MRKNGNESAQRDEPQVGPKTKSPIDTRPECTEYSYKFEIVKLSVV